MLAVNNIQEWKNGIFDCDSKTLHIMTNQKRRIAIIGGGISGLSAAYFLEEKDNVDVTLYERRDKIGGNALTVDAKTADGEDVKVDPVAYLFVRPRYPYFTQWVEQLGVKTKSLRFENYIWNDVAGHGTLIS